MKQSILYLDDEADCVNVFYETFHDDFDVRTATSAAEALRMLAEVAPEIVISDQKMPEMEGTGFLQPVAASYPESCRVMITGGPWSAASCPRSAPASSICSSRSRGPSRR